ncbi:MAG TPA: hypothetical protein VNX26_18545 [Candidatus Acidoferrum sp.]|jgi:hypothetical protein|nr:hypothetical protein [Candidatus Acidoferrum sp.]
MKRVRGRIRDFAVVALAALREIFDEAAYARFLSRAGKASSNEAYAAFQREFEEAKLRRPKCC